MKRRIVIENAMKAIKRDKILWESIGKYINDTTEVSHYMSIVQTRNHAKDIRYVKLIIFIESGYSRKAIKLTSKVNKKCSEK